MIRRTDNGSSEQHRLFGRDSLLRADERPTLASHLVTSRALYDHHGIYAGNGRVIHYAGLAHGWRRGPVEEVSLEEFARGRCIRVRHDAARFDQREVLERARSRLGERCYRILTNNCEHFCAWALQGENRSPQIERIRATPLVLWRAIADALRGHGVIPTYNRRTLRSLLRSRTCPS
jgi:hypothetical protein